MIYNSFFRTTDLTDLTDYFLFHTENTEITEMFFQMTILWRIALFGNKGFVFFEAS